MFTGGKSKYVSLLTLIKDESPVLYDMVSDLCLDGIFRSQRYETTFLMPSEDLVKKIKSHFTADEDEIAIDMIRSLVLKGCHQKDAFKSGAKIATMNVGNFVLSKPEEVGKKIDDMNKTFIGNKKGQVVNMVYKYTGTAPPVIEEGTVPTKPMPVGARGGMVGASEDKQAMGKLIKDLTVSDNHRQTLKNFFKAVAALLTILDNSDGDRFKRAKYYLAANPILSLYFLTMPGRGDALITKEELKDLKWDLVVDPEEIIKKAEHADYTLSKKAMGNIKSIRTQIVNDADKKSMIPAVIKAYKSFFGEHGSDDVVDPGCNATDKAELKLLMDENRYMYESSINCDDSVSDVISAMGAIDWTRPSGSLIIANQSVHDKLKCVEAFTSGPVLFVKSVYFLYVPLTETVEKQLMDVMKGGAIEGSNPATINSVMFSGGAARKALTKYSKGGNLSAFVKTLSKSQREALKQML